ncbi:MAG: hypothetical protein F2808_02145 [Actinobacteria bacterium]|nr:hypothetical protein [Actinomycetota bacterium]
MARPLVDRLTFPVPEAEKASHHLQIVSAASRRRRRPKAFFATVTVLTIFGIIVAQILLSISLQSGAYQISGLQHQMKDLTRTYESSTQDIDRMNSPQNVSESAESLGMVGKSNPVYLRLSDSFVTGSAAAAQTNGTLYSHGDMVPNEMLTPIRSERQAAATAAAAKANAKAKIAPTAGASVLTENLVAGSASASAADSLEVPSHQGIPSPSTH